MTELNTPPMMPQDAPLDLMDPAQAGSFLAGFNDGPPQMELFTGATVDLPVGYQASNGEVYREARVRELNGFDEEALSRIPMEKNAAVFVTELILHGTEAIGPETPSKDMIRFLSIGDRDTLLLGIRKATYGQYVPGFQLTCRECGDLSDVTLDLNEDIRVIPFEGARVSEVKLRHGYARIALLNGVAQEAWLQDRDKKTKAEVDTIMLSKSVIEINGIQNLGDLDLIRNLSAGDRATLCDWLGDHQPGPRLNDIKVNCSACHAEHSVMVGIPDLFRF